MSKPCNLQVGDIVKFKASYDGYFKPEKHLIMTVSSVHYYEGSYKVQLTELSNIEPYHMVNAKYLEKVQVSNE